MLYGEKQHQRISLPHQYCNIIMYLFLYSSAVSISSRAGISQALAKVQEEKESSQKEEQFSCAKLVRFRDKNGRPSQHREAPLTPCLDMDFLSSAYLLRLSTWRAFGQNIQTPHFLKAYGLLLVGPRLEFQPPMAHTDHQCKKS